MGAVLLRLMTYTLRSRERKNNSRYVYWEFLEVNIFCLHFATSLQYNLYEKRYDWSATQSKEKQSIFHISDYKFYKTNLRKTSDIFLTKMNKVRALFSPQTRLILPRLILSSLFTAIVRLPLSSVLLHLK